MLSKVRRTIERYDLFSPGDLVVVAVSGGPDSTALLLALAALAPELQVRLVVGHVNHMFRGAEAEADAEWVAGLAGELGIPFFREDANVPALIRRTGMTVEQAGREARYRFYARLARQTGATKVAVGQTRDDQAETVLMHLVRGAGLTGIAAIRPKRKVDYGWVVRPLLEVTRSETEAYCAAAGLTPRHDPYNDNPAYLRNRIRHQLLPWLKANANGNIKAALAQAADIWQVEDDYLAAATEAAYRGTALRKGAAVELSVSKLAEQPLALRRRLVRLAFSQVAATFGDTRDLGYEHTECVLALMAKTAGTSVDLPRGVSAERLYSSIRLARRVKKEKVVSFSYELAVPGTTLIPELGYVVITWLAEDQRPAEPTGDLVAQALFDYDRTGPDLYARIRRPGDWFYPSGLGGRKKLSDYFIDEKIPRHERERTLIIGTAQAVVWVVGRRTDERFVITGDTKNKIAVEVRRLTTADTEKGDTDERDY
ncbi:MAG: tRNA lysidine(34) synthetase TilS [bacterium]